MPLRYKMTRSFGHRRALMPLRYKMTRSFGYRPVFSFVRYFTYSVLWDLCYLFVSKSHKIKYRFQTED